MRNVITALVLLGLVIGAMLASVDANERKADRSREVSPYVPRSLQPVARLGKLARRVILALIGAWVFALARWGWVTVAATVAALAVGGFVAYRWRETIRRRKTVDQPLALALADILHIEDTRAWHRWLRIPRNLDDPDAEVRINLPPRWQGIAGERELVASLIRNRLPGAWEPHWELSGFNVRFTHPPPPPEHVIYDSAVSTVQHIIPIGQGSRGKWYSLNLRDKSPHILIAAPTRWGKTVFLTGLAAHFAHHGGIVDICDPKRVGFLEAFGPVDGNALPNVRLHTDVADMMRTIHEFYAAMSAVYRAKETGEDISDEIRFPSRMLILDEMGSLLEMVRYEWRKMQRELPASERNPKPDTVTEIMYGLWQGGFARFHIVTGAQQANADVLISSDARDQYGAKIATGPQSIGSWRMLYGLEPKQGTGRRKGDAIVGVGDSLTRIQLAYIEPGAARALATAGRERPGSDVLPVDAGDMPLSVLGRTESVPLVVGNAAGAEIVGLSPAAFVKARQRSPVPGQSRVGNQPAWTRESLVSWQSRRPRAGRTDVDAVL